MHRFVLACTFLAAVSTADAGDWYRCRFGGPFCGDCCVGQPAYDYSCAGAAAGMCGGFYDCPPCVGGSARRRPVEPTWCGRTAPGMCGTVTLTCCDPNGPVCCGAVPACCTAAPADCTSAAPACCAPATCEACESH